jgi:putative transposase
MKTIIKIQLDADGIGKKRLLDTMEAFNNACNEIAETCFEQKSGSKFNIQKLVYHHIREKYGLSAQLAIRAIAKTCEAYKLNKKKQPKFKKYGAITYDDRILTFKGLGGEFPQVSLTTLDGRRVYDIHIRNYFAGRVNRIKGQTDLVYQKGKFYLYATCDMPEDTPLEPDDFLGVDLGEVNIDTNVGIALEDLSGITKRTTVRKTQRAKRHSWSFYQLRQFITYKAKIVWVLAGGLIKYDVFVAYE